MTYLLDTHYMLWAITDTKKIARPILELISDPENKIIVSTVSFWEVALKSAIGKLEVTGYKPDDFPDACLKVGFAIECLSAADSSNYYQLKATYHKDPFDRMLIWQAIRNNFTFITVDSDVKKYKTEGLKLLAHN